MSSLHLLAPSRETWLLVCYGFPLVSVFSMAQFLTTWYPMGKTSTSSPYNLPGKIGWFLMEIPGTLTLLYTFFSVSRAQGINAVDLPWQNWAMVGMFTTHYIYRAILSPLLLNPSMAPIHAFVFLSALFFQVLNGLSIGGYLGGYGPTTVSDWAARPSWAVPLGMAVWAAGLAGNIYHDDVLRAIRRDADRKTKEKKEQASAKDAGRVEKVYEIPQGGLFGLVLYAHYFCEWVEWCGYWMAGGLACMPAQTFVLNEVATMLPRAWNGWHWYVGRFGRERIGPRKAVIPWLI